MKARNIKIKKILEDLQAEVEGMSNWFKKILRTLFISETKYYYNGERIFDPRRQANIDKMFERQEKAMQKMSEAMNEMDELFKGYDRI